MSDNFFPHAMDDNAEPPSSPPSSIAFATPNASATVAAASPIAFDVLANWLPRIGTVLWLERSENATASRDRANTWTDVLGSEHPACALLSRCTMASAHSAVTSQGPREWLCFTGDHGEALAKMFLLPDSDYLAWDQMSVTLRLASGAPVAHEPPTHATLLGRALAHFGQRRQARLLTFDLKCRQWQRTLGASAPLRISLLGLDLARGIVSDEGAEWISPLHAG